MSWSPNLRSAAIQVGGGTLRIETVGMFPIKRAFSQSHERETSIGALLPTRYKAAH